MSHTAPTTRSRWAQGLAFASVSVLIFSGWFVVTRHTVTQDLHIWDVAALRFGVGAMLLAPILLRQRLPARAWREGLLYAVLWGAPFVLLVALGLQRTTAAQASSIVPALMPVLAGLIQACMLRRRPPGRAIFSYAAILAGLAGLVASQPAIRSDFVGYGALVLAALTWAVYSIRFRANGLTALQAAALICFWSAILFIPVYAAAGLSRLGQASGQEIAIQFVYQGVLMSGVALFAYNRAIAALGPPAAAAMMALVPVLATLLAMPVLGEFPSALGAAAIVVIAAGVAMAARPARTAVIPASKAPLHPVSE
ncbi:DMT family transporter [Bordetella petrii]|uniref:DMT family transporter n=1 Tax=Bordetella petrii TaxID=94624 RepID=UPI001E58EFFA|nr:DMT family transporter [Bordetella petrii]MCD0503229.1 DMT family transporter [Bordetella petrii]